MSESTIITKIKYFIIKVFKSHLSQPKDIRLTPIQLMLNSHKLSQEVHSLQRTKNKLNAKWKTVPYFMTPKTWPSKLHYAKEISYIPQYQIY